jgi:hypothetical protein
MLRRAMGVSLDEKVEEEPIDEEINLKTDTNEDENLIDDDEDDTKSSKKSTTVCLLQIIYFLMINLYFCLFRIGMINMMIYKTIKCQSKFQTYRQIDLINIPSI